MFNAKQTEYLSSMESEDSCKRETIWLERDLIVPLAGTNTAFLYQTTNWWSQIKTAGSAIYANRHYLALYNKTNTERLTKEVKNNLALGGNNFFFTLSGQKYTKDYRRRIHPRVCYCGSFSCSWTQCQYW